MNHLYLDVDITMDEHLTVKGSSLQGCFCGVQSCYNELIIIAKERNARKLLPGTRFYWRIALKYCIHEVMYTTN